MGTPEEDARRILVIRPDQLAQPIPMTDGLVLLDPVVHMFVAVDPTTAGVPGTGPTPRSFVSSAGNVNVADGIDKVAESASANADGGGTLGATNVVAGAAGRTYTVHQVIARVSAASGGGILTVAAGSTVVATLHTDLVTTFGPIDVKATGQAGQPITMAGTGLGAATTVTVEVSYSG